MAPLRILLVAADLAILDATEVLVALVGYAPRRCRVAATARTLVSVQPPARARSDRHLEQPAAGRAYVVTLQHDARVAHLPMLVWSAGPQVAAAVAQCRFESVAVRTKPVLPAEALTLDNQLAQPSQPG